MIGDISWMPKAQVRRNSSTLFRAEAIDAKRGEWLGSINLATSRTQKLLAAAAMVLFVATTLLLIFGQYSRRMSLKGTLVEAQTAMAIEVSKASYLCSLLVQEGQRVEHGAPLAQTSTLPCEAREPGPTETIRAEGEGFIVGLNGLSPPARLVEGQRLMSIRRPNGSLVASLAAPDQIIGYVELGDEVSIRVDALPSQRFGMSRGDIVQIEPRASSESPTARPGYIVYATLDRSSLSLYGEDVPLHADMRITSSVILETRRLYEWIFEPLYLRRKQSAYVDRTS